MRLPRTPFLGCPQLQSPSLIFYQEPLPLPHLAIYCCNLLTSNMLHNRPHLGQGGSPGLPPSTWQGPVGPGAEGSLSVPYSSLVSPCPSGGPWLGTGPLANTSRGRGRDGVITFVSLELEEGSCLTMPFPEWEGHWDRTPVLATAICHSSY